MAAANLERGRERLSAGDIAGARGDCEAVLRSGASEAERAAAHLMLAACCRKTRDEPGALAHAQQAVRVHPADAIAHYALAESLEATGDMSGAIASVRSAIERKQAFVQAWNYLGILLGETGDTASAVDAFEAAVRIEPRHARAWNNLGSALRTLGRMPEAKQAFARALTLKPDYVLAAANLARAQRDVGELEQAEATVRAALTQTAHSPPFRPLLVLLAGLLRERNELDEAAQFYWRAIQAAPDESSGEWFNLGLVMSERGDPTRARDAFARSYAQDRGELRALLGRHLALPMVYDDAQAVETARSAYRSGLDALRQGLPAAVQGLTSDQVIDGLRWTNFFLAYQGQDDRTLQADYAELIARAIDAGAPQWHAPCSRRDIAGRRVRIGFASAFLHEGTVGRYFLSWITELDRARFEVFVYHLWPGMDAIAEAVRTRADVFRAFGGSDARPSVVAPAIRGDTLDVLVYPELGMDVTSFALAALRLAPCQLAAWGHPVSTGHPTIDAFLSCEVMEPADAQSQYTERLILLPGLGTSYRRPEVPSDAARAEFGLPDDRVLLLCPQSLFKIHPDNDALFADLLAANRRAMLVLFAGRHPAITDQFMQRLQRRCAERGLAVRERTRVLPPLPHSDYLRVNLACDAMVDTLHWSGGNTSLDALACGLPIVTLPGAHMRGRQSAGMLSLLGVSELIARDRDGYAAIAARIVDDIEWRHDLRARIRARQSQLFDRTDAIERLQAIFQTGGQSVD